MENIENDLRKRLYLVGKSIFKQGLVYGVAGNVSARIPGTRSCLIKPSGIGLDTLKPQDFLVVNIDTLQVVSEKGKLSIETPLHTRIYKLRENVEGVVHTHSHYATVLATCGTELKPIGIMVWRTPGLAKGVKVAKFAPPGSSELAKNLTEELSDRVAVLMPHHGVTAVGETVEEAFTTAQDVEALAQLTYECLLVGQPKTLPKSILRMILHRGNRLI